MLTETQAVLVTAFTGLLAAFMWGWPIYMLYRNERVRRARGGR